MPHEGNEWGAADRGSARPPRGAQGLKWKAAWSWVRGAGAGGSYARLGGTESRQPARVNAPFSFVWQMAKWQRVPTGSIQAAHVGSLGPVPPFELYTQHTLTAHAMLYLWAEFSTSRLHSLGTHSFVSCQPYASAAHRSVEIREPTSCQQLDSRAYFLGHHLTSRYTVHTVGGCKYAPPPRALTPSPSYHSTSIIQGSDPFLKLRLWGR